MKRGPHPPDSPDLAPSDFFLFSDVKRELMGYRAESEWKLLVRIRVILAEIPRDLLNAVSRVDGRSAKMYRDQWGLRRVS
jgi:hypothetical protein